MSMGQIYIYEYDFVDFGEFWADLNTEYNLKDVQHATWIKPCNPSTNPRYSDFQSEMSAGVYRNCMRTDNIT